MTPILMAGLSCPERRKAGIRGWAGDFEPGPKEFRQNRVMRGLLLVPIFGLFEFLEHLKQWP